MAKKTTAEPKGPLWPARDVLTRYGISDMTLWRWLKDSDLGFPRPVVINRRRYFYEVVSSLAAVATIIRDMPAIEDRRRRDISPDASTVCIQLWSA